jgi:CRP-like cAMP-binding protein
MEPLEPACAKKGCATCQSRLAGILSRLDPDAVARIDRAHIPHTYRRGQVLYYEGNPCHSVFCVSSGVVKVHRATSRGRRYILHLARAGEVLGLETLLLHERHESTAEMLEQGIICQIDRDELGRTFDARPELWRSVARVLAEQLIHSEEERAELVSTDLRGRLAAALLLLAGHDSEDSGHGVPLDVTLSRDDLADLIGASTEATIRQLSELRRRGLVSSRGRNLRLEDPSRLARIARLTEQSPG